MESPGGDGKLAGCGTGCLLLCGGLFFFIVQGAQGPGLYSDQRNHGALYMGYFCVSLGLLSFLAVLAAAAVKVWKEQQAERSRRYREMAAEHDERRRRKEREGHEAQAVRDQCRREDARMACELAFLRHA